MNWLKQLAGSLRIQKAPSDEVAALRERLEATNGLLDKERTINGALNMGYGLLAEDHQKKREADFQVIACLLSMMGNNVIINMDLFKTMREADLYINYQATDEGLLVQLLDEEQAKAVRAEAAKKKEAAKNAQ